MKHLESYNNYSSKEYYHFAYNCISPDSSEELESIMDDYNSNDNRNVDAETFLKRTNLTLDELNDILPVQYSNLEQFKEDWAIRFYIGEFYYDSDEEYNKEESLENGEEYNSENHGTLIQYACIVNSAIEHIFKK